MICSTMELTRHKHLASFTTSRRLRCSIGKPRWPVLQTAKYSNCVSTLELSNIDYFEGFRLAELAQRLNLLNFCCRKTPSERTAKRVPHGASVIAYIWMYIYIYIIYNWYIYIYIHICFCCWIPLKSPNCLSNTLQIASACCYGTFNSCSMTSLFSSCH